MDALALAAGNAEQLRAAQDIMNDVILSFQEPTNQSQKQQK